MSLRITSVWECPQPPQPQGLDLVPSSSAELSAWHTTCYHVLVVDVLPASESWIYPEKQEQRGRCIYSEPREGASSSLAGCATCPCSCLPGVLLLKRGLQTAPLSSPSSVGQKAAGRPDRSCREAVSQVLGTLAPLAVIVIYHASCGCERLR